MDIQLTKQVVKLCNQMTEAKRRLGARGAEVLATRLEQLHAAETLDWMTMLPGVRCHELKGQMKGLLAVDLHKGWRLVFEPGGGRVPRKPDGGLDWTRIRSIYITDIVDYHRG